MVALKPRLETKHLDFITASKNKQKEDLEAERARLKREEDLIKKNRERQGRIWWVIGVAGIIAGGLFYYASQESAKAAVIRQNLQKRMELSEALKDVPHQLWLSEKIDNGQIDLPDLPSTIIDPRDKKIYETIKLNGKVWMAENMDFETKEGSWCYRYNPGNKQ